MADLVDTNIPACRFDPRDPRKQRIAAEFLRRGIADGSVRVPHQAIVEFIGAVTRGESPLLERAEAYREAEEMLGQFEVLYPDESLVRTAIRGAAAYQLSWFDAHV